MVHHFKRLLMSAGVTGVFITAVISIVTAPASRSIESALATSSAFTLSLQQVATGLAEPVYLTHAGDNSGRLFVVERAGRIRVIRNGVLQSTPFLSITNRVNSTGIEQGLLSVAFDPSYASNGTFYVDYTAYSGPAGDTVIARYVVANPASDVPTVLTVTNLVTISQPETNHNGGQLQFGPNDGYLYVGMGDGGGGGDQHGSIGNGQDLTQWLGKLLRLNVRGVPTYTLPATNPFTATANARPEIWAYGLRNPWRFSFDRANGDLYIGDVGQNCYEEIDYQPGGSHGGENYGWRLMEGFYSYPTNCDQPIVPPGVLITLTRPITDYYHGTADIIGDAVSGGYVYRGTQYPWMNGVYFYGDFGSGRIWQAEQVSPGVWQTLEQLDTGYSLSSFGEDQSGELYAVDFNGGIYHVVSSQPTDLSATSKQPSRGVAHTGDVFTYTIVLRNSGDVLSNTLRLTDTVPTGLSYVSGSFTATRGIPDAASAPTLKWQGVMSNTFVVTLTYAVSVTAVQTQAINNIVVIDPGFTTPFSRSATIIVNGPQDYLPLIFKNS